MDQRRNLDAGANLDAVLEHPARHPGDRAMPRCAVDLANYFLGLNPVADGAQSMKWPLRGVRDTPAVCPATD